MTLDNKTYKQTYVFAWISVNLSKHRIYRFVIACLKVIHVVGMQLKTYINILHSGFDILLFVTKLTRIWTNDVTKYAINTMHGICSWFYMKLNMN